MLDLAEVWRILNHPAVRVRLIVAGRKMPRSGFARQWPARVLRSSGHVRPLRLKQLAELWPSDTLGRVSL